MHLCRRGRLKRAETELRPQPCALLFIIAVTCLRHAELFDTTAQPLDWVVRQAHGDVKWEQRALKLTIEDRNLLEKSETRPYFSGKNDCSNAICFSTSLSYQGEIEKILAKYIPMQPKQGRVAAVPRRCETFDIGWGRILVDEVHVECYPTAGTIKRVQMLNNTMKDEMPRTIFISGTPFESSPQHIAGWIETIEDQR